jgi:glycosyltransferase involved in cell wall biosynthesis
VIKNPTTKSAFNGSALRQMRIALCLEYPIDQRGGTEVLVSELIRGFSKSHHVILASPDDAASIARSPIAPFVAEHISFTPGFNDASNARRLAERIALAKPDIAHFHFGGVYGWGNRFPFRCPIYFLNRLKVPCFSTVHLVVGVLDGFCGPQKPLWFKLLMLPLSWWGKLQQLRHTKYEIAVSQHDFQKLRRWYWPFSRRFRQIYHSRLREIEAEPPPERAKIILNVGHIAQRKGQAVLAKAFAKIAPQYPEWILQLAGNSGHDGETDRIQQLSKKDHLEKRILLLGPRSDAIELMQRSAIYVQPSFWEALGLALQEAMFAGCACVGSRAGGIPELIQHEQNGLLVEPGNVDDLALALENLITNPDRREQLGCAAAAAIRRRKMTSPQMIAAYLELYETSPQ